MIQEDCYLAFLDAQAASQLVLKEDKKDSEKVVNLFMNTIFKGVERTYIEKMVYSFTKGHAQCGEPLISYGEIPTHIYVVRKGFVKVVQTDR